MALILRFLMVAVLSFPGLSAFAQKDSTLKHIDLDEFVYNSGKLKSKKYKARLDHVTQHILPPHQGGHIDTVGDLTHFPALGTKAVSIREVVCRVDEYDTSDLSMFLIFLQIHDGDTIIRRASLDRDIIKHNRTVHHFASSDAISIEPGDFYLGYAYLAKGSEPIERRLYCSERSGGEGARLRLMRGEVRFFPSENFSTIFPFTIRYY